ncbi:hypothetical protein WJX75_002969 [Coccomyxa subellipsoidea]|uniref:Uncharacterized protein n=1 Tax=Coccomyxa subellipsoidea TaxID=248742 RepID=A0ABR2YKL1_9CHLO
MDNEVSASLPNLLDDLPQEYLGQDINNFFGCQEWYPPVPFRQGQLPAADIIEPEEPLTNQAFKDDKYRYIEMLRSYISSCGGRLSEGWQVTFKIKRDHTKRTLYIPPDDFVPADGETCRSSYQARTEVARAMGLVAINNHKRNKKKEQLHSCANKECTEPGDGSLALCNVRRGRGRPRRNAAGNLLTADCLPAAAGQTQLQEGTLAVYTGAPASGPLLMGSGFDCKDSTRAIIEEMLQKDRDLETAQSHRKYLTEKVQVTNAKLEACEATKGQLATQVAKLQRALAQKEEELAETGR